MRWQSISSLPFVKLLIRNAKVPVKSQSSPSWQELSAMSWKTVVSHLRLRLCKMGTKHRCQAKCFILPALLRPPYTFSSGQTVGHFPPNRASNDLDPFLPRGGFWWGNTRAAEAGSAYSQFWFITEIISTKHRSVSSTDSKQCFLACRSFVGWPATHWVSCSWSAKKTWSREAQAGSVPQVGSNIRCCATKPEEWAKWCGGSHVKDGGRPFRRWVWTHGDWLPFSKGGSGHREVLAQQTYTSLLAALKRTEEFQELPESFPPP